MRPTLCAVVAAATTAACAGAAGSSAAGPNPPDVDVLLQHLDDLYRSRSSIARIQIDVTTTRRTRTMRLRALTRGEADGGGSYRVPIGSGILAFVESQHSGFGASRPEGILALVSTPGFRERYLRGDTQIVSRHAPALTGSYEASPEFTYAGQWVHNPGDRSRIVAPSVTYTLSDHVSLLGTAYVPYGRTPRAQMLRSEFGSASHSALLQLRIYL